MEGEGEREHLAEHLLNVSNSQNSSSDFIEPEDGTWAKSIHSAQCNSTSPAWCMHVTLTFICVLVSVAAPVGRVCRRAVLRLGCRVPGLPVFPVRGGLGRCRPRTAATAGGRSCRCAARAFTAAAVATSAAACAAYTAYAA